MLSIKRVLDWLVLFTKRRTPSDVETTSTCVFKGTTVVVALLLEGLLLWRNHALDSPTTITSMAMPTDKENHETANGITSRHPAKVERTATGNARERWYATIATGLGTQRSVAPLWKNLRNMSRSVMCAKGVDMHATSVPRRVAASTRLPGRVVGKAMGHVWARQARWIQQVWKSLQDQGSARRTSPSARKRTMDAASAKPRRPPWWAS